MKKIFVSFMVLVFCAMSMTSVFASGSDHAENSQKTITLQEYYNLFESVRDMDSRTVSEIIKLNDKEFAFRFYAEDLMGKPKCAEKYFEVYSPYVGGNFYHEATVDGILYKGYLTRGKIAEVINGEYRYWYVGWLGGCDPDSGISPFSKTHK